MSQLFKKCLECCKKLELRNGLDVSVAETNEKEESLLLKICDALTRNTLEIELYVLAQDDSEARIAASIHLNHRTLGLKQLLNLQILLDTAGIVIADILNDCNSKPRRPYNSRYKKETRSDTGASLAS